jgi:uncharacterized protein YbcI
MDEPQYTMAHQVARSAVAFEKQRTGHAPDSVTVVMSRNILVITLSGSLSPAERALSQEPAGAEQVREFHRQLFASSSGPLRDEIRRITGVEVREAAAETPPTESAMVAAFTTGTTVQVFLLAERIAADTWSDSGLGEHF